jgi:branched-chain amino acid transport system ATP-binding protein
MSALLEACDVHAGYGGLAVVRGLDLAVERGQVVAVLGANGAGKTTALRTLAGLQPPLAGTVSFKGSARGASLHSRARRGMAYVPEGRSVFTQLTAAQNLRVGGVSADAATAVFPELEPLLGRRAGLLSGGEQQMLTLGRALARSPEVLLADELSLGLAPLVVDRLLRAVRAAVDGGIGAVIVEQHVHRVLEIADRVILLRQGRVEFDGDADDARRAVADIEAAYVGTRTSATTSSI